MICSFGFSAEWDGLTKIAVFVGSGTTVDMVVLDTDVTIPYEVLTTAGGDLVIGVYGTDGNGKIIIPTVWANAGRIRNGTLPKCETEPEPTPTVIDQVLTAAANAVEQAETVSKEQADIAQGYAQDAKTYAETSEHYYELSLQTAEGKGFIWFDILADGCLYMWRTENIADDFDAFINDDGELVMVMK